MLPPEKFVCDANGLRHDATWTALTMSVHTIASAIPFLIKGYYLVDASI